MKQSTKLSTIRRRVGLLGALVKKLSAVTPAERVADWNRLMTVGLREYAARRRALAFESQMAAMAADRGVQGECAIIGKEFSVADLDGLRQA